jgi:hypothetical protein
MGSIDLPIWPSGPGNLAKGKKKKTKETSEQNSHMSPRCSQERKQQGPGNKGQAKKKVQEEKNEHQPGSLTVVFTA